MLERMTTPVPPFPALLTHNDPPSTLENRTVRDALSEIYTKIAGIDAELARLQSAKEKLERFRDQHEGAVSAIRCVPNEILSEIMTHCWASRSRKEPAEAQRSAIVLASVCSRWRAAALSTHQLWTTVLSKRPHDFPALKHLMLSRSGDYSLKLHIYGSDLGELTDDSWPLIEAIKPHLHRVCHISAESRNLTINMLSPTPPLQRLHTVKFAFSADQYELFQVFQTCPVLEDVDVKLCVSADRGPNQGSFYEMPKLRRLFVTYVRDPSRFFEHLIAPNLAEVGTVVMGSEPWPITGVTDLLQRSKCCLKKMNLDWPAPTAIELCQLFDSVSNLEEISINGLSSMKRLIYEHLTVRKEHPTRLRELKTLITSDFTGYFCVDSLHAMLTSRLLECPLSKVVVEYLYIRPDFEEILSEFGRVIEGAQRLEYALEFQEEKVVFNIDILQ